MPSHTPINDDVALRKKQERQRDGVEGNASVDMHNCILSLMHTFLNFTLTKFALSSSKKYMVINI